MAGVQRPRAAKGQQHEVAQVVPAHGRDRLDGFLHLDVDDARHAFRGARNVHAQRSRDLRLDRGDRRRRVELHLAAEEIVRAQIAERQIAVGDGGSLAAAPVAGGTGLRAGALRADDEFTEPIDSGQRAAAGAHRVDVDHRQGDVAALDLAAIGDRRFAILDERDIAGGAAHVEGDEIGKPGGARRVNARGNAARRP